MFTDQLVELMHSWFHQHRFALCSYGPIDGCVVVPSTRGRQSVLNEALTANPIGGLGVPLDVLAANRRTTPTRTPSPHLFRRTNEQPGKRLVLIDDVYVTGSTAQSAAHTLEGGLATIAYVLVIGRRINPVAIANEYGIEHPAYKTHQEPTS